MERRSVRFCRAWSDWFVFGISLFTPGRIIGFGRLPHSPACRGLPDTTEENTMIDHEIFAAQMAACKNSGWCAKVGAALPARRNRGSSDRH